MSLPIRMSPVTTMLVVIVALAALALGRVLATQRAQASTGVRPCALSAHCYLVVDLGVRDINSHISNANAIGGHLATISDAAENATVFALLTTTRTWIGFSDAAVEGTFVWLNGDPVTFVNWNPGEPNSAGSFSNEDYVEIFNFSGGTWNDINPGESAAPTSSVVEFEILDTDGDGVLDVNDICSGTVIPESIPTTGKLGVNRWALTDGDGNFDTTAPKGKGPQLSYTIDDTAGCSGEQIADALELGKGHYKFGLSIGAMDEWIGQQQ